MPRNPIRSAITAQHAVDPDRPNGSGQADRMTMIFRVEDADTGRILKEHHLVVMPRAYSYVPEGRARILYTRDGAFVDSPLTNGVGFTRFSISGSTNWRPYASADGKVVIDGAAALKDLDDTIRCYFLDDLKVPVLGGSEPPSRRRLVFVNLDHPVSKEDPSIPEWHVHPDRLVQTSKTAQRPFVYDYQLSFVALRSKPYPDDRTPITQQTKPNLKSLAARLRDAPLDAIAKFESLREQYLNPLKSILTDLSAAVENFANGVQKIIDTTAAEVSGAIARIAAMETAIVTLSQTPWYALAQARALKRDLRALLNVRDAFGNPNRRRSDVERFKASLDPPAPTFTFNQTTRSASQTDTPVEVEVEDGDTLASIAQRYGVDALAIVLLGDLRSPFVDSSQSRPATDPVTPYGKRVVYAGERILVPSATMAAAYAAIDVARPLTDNPVRDGRAVPLEEVIFGNDFYLSPDGLVELDSASGDFRLVRGLVNLIQAIDTIALPMRLGSLVHNPWKGSRLLEEVGAWTSARDVRVLGLSIEKTLRSDPRIAAVRDVTVDGGGGKLAVRFLASAVNGRQLITRATA